MFAHAGFFCPRHSTPAPDVREEATDQPQTTVTEKIARVAIASEQRARHKDITGLDMLRSTAVVREGKVVEYRIDAKMTPALETDRGEV